VTAAPVINSAVLPSLPPPSRRTRGAASHGAESEALALLFDVRDVLSTLGERSPADFRLLPAAFCKVSQRLGAAFSSDDPLPPTLVSELAPLLVPRLDRLAPRLRRRLARERQEQPLGRIREMDPACLRRNSRLPGRTLIEKAGPLQRLHGVKRVPRFDTMENRVLASAARYLNSECAALLRTLPSAARAQAGGRAVELRKLERSTSALLARPELEHVGAPRPSERPSNALLGDPDYRAAWRALGLLRREDERFGRDWSQLSAGWTDLLQLALWAHLDARSDLEPLPGWLRIGTGCDGSRLDASESRRWWRETAFGPEVVRVLRTSDTVAVTRTSHDGTCARWEIDGRWDFLGASTEWRKLAWERSGQVDAWLGHVAEPSYREKDFERSDMVALSLLDRAALRCDGATSVAGVSAAAVLDVPDEASISYSGREATWLHSPAGPLELHRAHALRVGSLLAPWCGRETALVVPDAMPLLARSELRRSAGAVWLIPAPIAAVLGALPRPSAPGCVLVVVETDACLDIAVVESLQPPERDEWVWVRSAPLHDGSGGRESRRVEEGASSHGVWLRTPGASGGWGMVGDSPGRHAWSSTHSNIDQLVREALRGWQGGSPTGLLSVGLSDEDRAALEPLGHGRAEHVCSDVLVSGAHRFLRDRAQGTLTWMDRLPRLDLVVRSDNLRQRVPLVPANELVAPGARVAHNPLQEFALPSGEPIVDLRLELEGRDSEAVVRLQGAPLPLGRAARVRVQVSYEHGRGDVAGALVPVDPGSPFQRIPFLLAKSDVAVPAASKSQPNEALSPPTPALLPPSSTDMGKLDAAVEALQRVWNSMERKAAQRSVKQPGALPAEFAQRLREVKSAAMCIRGTDIGALPPDLRLRVEAAASQLDWFLGCGTGTKGRAPMLSPSEQDTALAARAALRVRGNGAVAAGLADGTQAPRDRGLRLLFLGLLIDGEFDEPWQHLVEHAPSDPHEMSHWAMAVVRAFEGHCDVAARLDGESARALLEQALTCLERLAADAKRDSHGQAVFRLTLVLCHLCRTRAQGHLAPHSDLVASARDRLALLRDQLPESVRRFGGRAAVTAGDEPIETARDYLAGRYSVLPSMD
jgi:hypothetical protein